MPQWSKILVIVVVVVLLLVAVAIGILIRVNPGLPLNDLGLGIELDQLALPRGFSVSVFAEGVEGARSLVVGESGTVFVGSRGPGKVYALLDEDGDGRSDRTLVVAEGLDSPNGVALFEGDLYVAEISRVLRFDGIEERLQDPPAPVVVNDSFPTEALHGWKFIAFGPDALLYVPVGAPCNACEPTDERFATIMRMRPDGTDLEIFARGVRNTVGFDWHPATGQLWFTDNGRDWMGDDQPPDELNRAPVAGLHFGFPYIHGVDNADPDIALPESAGPFTPPVRELGAHVAALGMLFYEGAMFPSEYRGQVFIAEHGSWNRSSPAGYRVSLVNLEGDRAVGYEPFMTGFERDRRAWGRPVDLRTLSDGSLLVSDDRAGAVYRVVYGG
jgi:glucose/arabinose dehydrogenase